MHRTFVLQYKCTQLYCYTFYLEQQNKIKPNNLIKEYYKSKERFLTLLQNSFIIVLINKNNNNLFFLLSIFLKIILLGVFFKIKEICRTFFHRMIPINVFNII